MVRTFSFLILFWVFLGVTPASGQVPQVPHIREVQTKTRASKPAPVACVGVFRAFFTYLQNQQPNIVTDEQSQNRWLSRLMRKAFATHIQRSGTPNENPDYPSNQTFLGVWNNPSTVSIVGSRHYDHRNTKNLNANRAVIDVLYEWDMKVSPNNNYPGDRSLRSFIFVYEDGAWKLDDVYTFAGTYSTAESLRAYFEQR